MTPLPRQFADLAPNVLIARCVQCRRLAYASELCVTSGAVLQCPNMSEPMSNVAKSSITPCQEAPLARPVI